MFAQVVSPHPASIKAASTYLKPPVVLKSSTSSAMEEDYYRQAHTGQLTGIHMIKHDADVIAERLIQEARLKRIKAEQENQMEIQALKLEESKQVAQRDLFRQQLLINDEKDGLFVVFFYFFALRTIIPYVFLCIQLCIKRRRQGKNLSNLDLTTSMITIPG